MQAHARWPRGCLGWETCRVKCFLLCMQEAHIARLQGSLDASGDASLQNAMNLATESLKAIPPYGHREVRATTCMRRHTCSLPDAIPHHICCGRAAWGHRHAVPSGAGGQQRCPYA